jgi:hypothetical protein
MTHCAGKTQKGARCKREAREGSSYCSIHLEQEARPRAEHARSEWTSDDILEAAIGFGLIAAIVLFRLRR